MRLEIKPRFSEIFGAQLFREIGAENSKRIVPGAAASQIPSAASATSQSVSA
jgi:hypothetical protein